VIDIQANTNVIKDIEDELDIILEEAMKELAERVKTDIVESIDKGDDGWLQLSETTKFLTGRDRAHSSGELARSIRAEVDGKTAKIGVLVPKGESGRDMLIAANVAENGAYIQVTEKMRDWFAARGKALRKTTSVIRIPPRPIFAPSSKKIDERIDEIFGDVLDQVVEIL
jgi:hypothetical protein